MDNIMTKSDIAEKIVELQFEIKNAEMKNKINGDFVTTSINTVAKNFTTTSNSIPNKPVGDIVGFTDDLRGLNRVVNDFKKLSEEYITNVENINSLKCELYKLNELWRTERYVGGSNEGKPINL